MLNDDLLTKLESKLDALKFNNRKMFGGIGIFIEKIMFALIYDGVLYFRSTEEIALNYSKDSYQFQHPSRHSKMPYWSISEEIINDNARLIGWAKSAFNLAKSLKNN